MASIVKAAVPHRTAGERAARSGEFRTVLLLTIGCGLVGLDRFIISPLFPVMAKELGLSYQDLGLVSGVLALTWGLSSIFTGQFSDYFGRKRVIVSAVLIFSLLVAFTGLATGLGSLLIFRAIMGVAEGAFMPTCIVTTVEVSKPSRMGMNVGITQMAVGLVGLGLGPIIATQVLQLVPSWHWVFAIVAVPGLLLAWIMSRLLQDPSRPLESFEKRPSAPLWAVLRHGNVVAITIASACWFSSLVVLAAFLPNYLTDHLHLGLQEMGLVLSAAGIGSVIGMVGVAALSDRFGRKRVLLCSLVLQLVCLFALRQAGPEPILLFVLVLLVYLFNTGAVAVGIGPLTSLSVPPHLSSTATGVVMGVGEVVGGAIVPVLTGSLADAHGIEASITVCLVAVVICILVTAAAVREPSTPASV